MPSEQATILIPDISGYTEFVSKAEIEHSAQILKYLLETIVEAAGDPVCMQFIPGIRDNEFIIPVAAIGMPHTWRFATQSIEAIPMGIDVTNSSILYWEEIRVVETGDHVIVEYVFDHIDKEKSGLGIHLYKVPGKDLSPQSAKQLAILFDSMLVRMKEVIGKE